MIEIKDLNKSFGKDKVLKNINLNIEKGKVYALIGRNGIGKTTLLNIIGNRIKKDSGNVLLDGKEIYENPKLVEQIVLIKDTGFGMDALKVNELMNIGRSLYKNWNEEKYRVLLEDFDFKKNLKKNYSKLSRGNKTIVGIILGIASDSEYLLLDEPTIGLDAVYRDIFNQVIFREIEEGKRAIVISTHLIDESAKLIEEVILIKEGKVILQDNIYNILEKSYSIKGLEEDIYPILKNKNILEIEKFGSSIIVNILDDLSVEERKKILQVSGEIDNIGIQKIFVYLTKNK